MKEIRPIDLKLLIRTQGLKIKSTSSHKNTQKEPFVFLGTFYLSYPNYDSDTINNEV